MVVVLPVDMFYDWVDEYIIYIYFIIYCCPKNTPTTSQIKCKGLDFLYMCVTCILVENISQAKAVILLFNLSFFSVFFFSKLKKKINQ